MAFHAQFMDGPFAGKFAVLDEEEVEMAVPPVMTTFPVIRVIPPKRHLRTVKYRSGKEQVRAGANMVTPMYEVRPD